MKLARMPWVLGVVLVTGCNTDLYYWGRYEDAVHYAYAHADKWDRTGLIDLMEQDQLRSRKAEKPLPPGWHAHLGLLYYDAGQPDRALNEFAAEKQQFPESAVFMDRLLERLATGEGQSRTNQPLTTTHGGREHLAEVIEATHP
jgi:hypothetical protein